MTVSSTNRKAGPYTGTGAVSAYPFSFIVFSAADVRVVRADTAGNESDLVLNSDYTVTLNADQSASPGGTVNLTSPLTTGYALAITSQVAELQSTELTNSGGFYPTVINRALDRLTVLVQQVSERVSRALQLGITAPAGVNPELPAPSGGRVLGWNGDGTRLMNFDPTAGGYDALRADLTGAATNKGAGLPAFSGALNYVAATIGARLNDIGSSPRSLGAVGDGVADDAAAIQACLLYSRTLDMRNRSWKIGSTITAPSGAVVDMRSAYVVADVGATSLFSFTGAGDGLAIIGGGGTVTGTASAFLYVEGSTTTPTSQSQYGRQIRIDGVHVSSATIGLFVNMQKAARQLFVDRCMIYTASGILCSGKCVEIKIHKSIIYSSTAADGTFGVKLESPAGSSYYCEGVHVTDCTIDNFQTTFDVTDIFVLTVTGGYIGRRGAGGYVALFGQPTSTLCIDIKFTGVMMNGPVKFAPTGGREYSTTFTGCTTTGVSGGYCIEFGNNASSISVRAHKFRNCTGAIAIRGANNNYDIVVDGVDCDSTLGGGVYLQGANGDGCEVHNLKYKGAGEPFYFERQVRFTGLPIHTTIGATIRQTFNSASLAGAVAVGSNIASIQFRLAKGQTAVIVGEIRCTGMAAYGSQLFQITPPAGMVLPNGTGWDSVYVYPQSSGGSGAATFRIPVNATADIYLGTLSISNAAGNTATVLAHSYFGIVKDL